MKPSASSSVGRGNRITNNSKFLDSNVESEKIGLSTIFSGDSLDKYKLWDPPKAIISDGGYGILGFQGDTSDPSRLVDWYEPHIDNWTQSVKGSCALWFWNSEVGWANVHSTLVKYGWEYRCCNIWNKTKSHIAGNVNTAKLRSLPVVTEVCALYFKSELINGKSLKDWFISEWERTGLPNRVANEACNLKDAATRKYLDKGHLWYFPPSERFEMIAKYANKNGKNEGKPYFSIDGKNILSGDDWNNFRQGFSCPYGKTNVWERLPLKGSERVKLINGTKAAHLNQKPIDLTEIIINASTQKGEVVWEPFGGLMTACLVSNRLERKSFSSEIEQSIFEYSRQRLKQDYAEYQASFLPSN